MKRTLPVIGFCFAVLLFSHCKSSQHLSQTSEAIDETNVLRRLGQSDSNIKGPIVQKVWRQNNFGITQIVAYAVVEGDNYPDGRLTIFGYRFVDLKKNWAYEYFTLTDTASVQRKYQITDTTKYFGGWHFNNTKLMPVDSFQLLNDTVINSVVFKQCKIRLTL